MYDVHKMFSALWRGQPIKVASLLALDTEHININKPLGNIRPPLFIALHKSSTYPFTARHYECIILLLEAGADPFYQHSAKERPLSYETPFYIALEDRNLATLRLMLMKMPDYEEKVVAIHGDGPGLDAGWLADLKESDLVEKHQPPGFAQYLKDAANDSRLIHQYKTEATTLATQDNLTEAAAKYEQAAALYARQAELEATLPYYPPPSYLLNPDDDPPEKCRWVLIAHYQKKQEECLEQLYPWYQSIDRGLSQQAQAAELSPALKRYHIEVLDRLVSLGQQLKKPAGEVEANLSKLIALKSKIEGPIARLPKAPENFNIASWLPGIDTTAVHLEEEGETATLLSEARSRHGSGSSGSSNTSTGGIWGWMANTLRRASDPDNVRTTKKDL